jgi:hypothetical protein
MRNNKGEKSELNIISKFLLYSTPLLIVSSLLFVQYEKSMLNLKIVELENEQKNINSINNTLTDENKKNINQINEENKLNADNKSKIQNLEIKVDCSELIKVTPDRGPGLLVGRDIVNLYKESLDTLNKIESNPSRPNDSDDVKAEKKFWEELVKEAKPLYENYISKCQK